MKKRKRKQLEEQKQDLALLVVKLELAKLVLDIVKLLF